MTLAFESGSTIERRSVMKIAVGGYKRVGRHLVDLLSTRGHEVVAISRFKGVDMIMEEGLAKALAGFCIPAKWPKSVQVLDSFV
jgi:glutamate dehydrogenase/leucine dehydrogenase